MSNIQLDNLWQASNGRHVAVMQTVACVNDQSKAHAVSRGCRDTIQFLLLLRPFAIRIAASMQFNNRRSDSNGRVVLEATAFELTISEPMWEMTEAEENAAGQAVMFTPG